LFVIILGVTALERVSSSQDRAAVQNPHTSDRRLSEGHPDLLQHALDVYVRGAQARADERPRIDQILRDLEAIADLTLPKTITVVGCGPYPTTVAVLRDKGFDVLGVEPVASFVDAAKEYLSGCCVVLHAGAEEIPLDDESQDVVFLESVLEHVDSPRRSLEEVYRILRSGGVAFITTTNRYSLRPVKAEFNIPYYQWLPALLKESYVFFHLHYRPSLANFTQRPAVHWFSFSDLCAIGRDAGFAQFYSHLDLRREEYLRGRGWKLRLRVSLLNAIQTRPLVRTLALTQRGGEIFMLKR
jgi:SAM-dependent methyltransferase